MANSNSRTFSVRSTPDLVRIEPASRRVSAAASGAASRADAKTGAPLCGVAPLSFGRLQFNGGQAAFGPDRFAVGSLNETILLALFFAFPFDIVISRFLGTRNSQKYQCLSKIAPRQMIASGRRKKRSGASCSQNAPGEQAVVIHKSGSILITCKICETPRFWQKPCFILPVWVNRSLEKTPIWSKSGRAMGKNADGIP